MNEPYPYVVEVKHNPNAKRTYCFFVPATFSYMVAAGTRLEVETAYGKQQAIAVSRATCDPETVREMMERTGATTPLRKVIAYQTMMDPRVIVVPVAYLMTPPSRKKLRLRMQEYRLQGKFHTRVEVTNLSLTLRDGYSAYIAARKLGLSAIPVWVAAETPEEREAFVRELG